ncbi:MAG: hypothetical protein H5U07_03410 [Candidatus Aminicenantes bacterium]|nr:hypothetical protein [Candidatus Aminicenantes bacterium]
MAKKKIIDLIILIVIISLTSTGLFAQRSLQDKSSGWSVGLMSGFFSRGIKCDTQIITMNTPAGLLLAKGQNLGWTVDLSFFAGYGNSGLNGILFDRLPVSLDYQAGGIGGWLFGVKADWPIFSVGDYTFGLSADLMTFLGEKKSFSLEGFAEPGNATIQPNWSQASSGFFLLYDGLEKIQPFLIAEASFFWGTFKATETISDLTGSQGQKLKASGLLRLTAGGNYKLAENFLLVPSLTVYPASKTAISAELSLLYSF